MNEIQLKKRYEISSNTVISTIVFISDLHFDFVYGEECPEQSEVIRKSFIDYIKKNYSRSIICILGDSYGDYLKVLSFIRELEKEKIIGFYVLGNHDFWNDGTKDYKEVIQFFEESTGEHQFFRLLTTGRKYYIGEMCFIGDTGWTSFVRNGEMVELSKFMSLPEKMWIKNFSPKQIISMHNNWIKFANKVLGEEKQVIILTHYPMVDFTKKSEDCWWSSETKLIESKNCWKIFGHTHKTKQKKKNNVSAQRGYNNKDIFDLERYGHLYGWQQYNAEDFGMLIRIKDVSSVPMINLEPLVAFYSPYVIQNPSTEIEQLAEVKRRGFKRCSKNREIFAELATRPYEYLHTIKEYMKDYEKSDYIGYKYSCELSEKTVYAIHTAIATLERIFDTNDFSNPQIVVMSAIITGYVYNYMAWEIDKMRPIDYYDVVRFYFVFQTMKRYNLGFGEISSIKKHKSRVVRLANLDVCLPSVDKHCMTVEEAYACIKGTPLLSQMDLIESDNSAI